MECLAAVAILCLIGFVTLAMAHRGPDGAE
jgi:hypothetical protein